MIGIFKKLGIAIAIVSGLTTAARAESISLDIGTTIGHYSFAIDSSKMSKEAIGFPGVTLISFEITTDAALFPAPLGIDVTAEDFGFAFGVSGDVSASSSFSASGSDLPLELQNSSMFLSGIVIADPSADYSRRFEFNVTSFTAMAVPLPPSFSLLAGALVGFGIVGYGVKRANAAAA